MENKEYLNEEARQDTPQALEEALAEMKRQLEALVEEKLSLMTMTDEERADYDARSRESALNERERAIQRRELRAEALEQLTRRGLPAELADTLGYDSPEALTAAIDAMDKAFRLAVQQAVRKRLSGSVPAAGAPGRAEDEMDDDAYYRAHAMG